MELIWGINALNHDASITVMRGNEILFAGHSERYSRVKNDSRLNIEIVADAMKHGLPDKVVCLDRPWVKKSRQLYAGQYAALFEQSIKSHLREVGIVAPIHYVGHHEAHAAAGFYTSPFESAAVIVVDAIGEWDTVSVWLAQGDELIKKTSVKYPDSVGLLYSAFTHRVGLKPNEEEYILMGMAAYGQPIYKQYIKDTLIANMKAPNFELRTNVHKGILNWAEELGEDDYCDIAASIQSLTEDYMIDLAKYAADLTGSENLVIMGGCALNCVANEKIARENIFKDIWIMPNPGDAGNSLGAILAHTREKAKWITPNLGWSINKTFNQHAALEALETDKIIAIANGPAEFGPRALGNRSLIADPRGNDIKDKVNDIKKRQRFRPFAPIILEHLAHEYFDMPVLNSPYMQFTAKCKFPELFPAICHVDGSSRVQTLSKNDNPQLYAFLCAFYEKTGCPILLNTSLNIKGEPLVNTWQDAKRFSEKYKVKVF